MKQLIPIGYYNLILINLITLYYYGYELYVVGTGTLLSPDGWRYLLLYVFIDVFFLLSAIFFLLNKKWKLILITALIAFAHNLTISYINVSLAGVVISVVSIIFLVVYRLNSKSV
jgi:hypothetical protein